MSRQRPYRQRSPYRQAQDPYHASNILRSELTMLEEENAILKVKCIKVAELQEKVQLVLKQNAQLLAQNEKMARILHQQKLDNESLTARLDSTSAQKKAFIGEFEVQRKKLIQELERTRDALMEMELKKNNQLSQIKNNQQVELQALKRQISQAESSSEHEIRRCREQLEKREQELNDYVGKLKRITTETDYEILKLKEDKEKLKAELNYREADHAKEVEHLKSKLENNYLQELEALKRAHVNALEEAERENTRLRNAYEDRGRELDQLTTKFGKQKQVLEDNLTYLKKDNEALRNKVYDTEQMGHFELNNLKERLANHHEEEISEILVKFQGQVKVLEDEIGRLESVVQAKNGEIQQQLKDKVTNRNMFDAELGRVKDDYAIVLQKYKDQEAKLADFSSQSAARLSDREKHIQYLESLNKEQKANSENEIAALQKAIEALRQDLNSERMLAKQTEQAYKEEVSGLKRDLEEANYNAQRREKDLQKTIQDLKDELNGTSANLSNRAEGLSAKNRALEKENQALKNSLAQKEKQIRNLNERLKASNERETRLEAEIDDLRNKLIKREQSSNETIKDQKSRLEASYSNALESLKADHAAAMRLEGNKIRDLQEKLRKKENELEELLRMYKKMTEEVQVLTHQEANKKEITLKFPGATADLIASKNLFDVYLKTKVLDVCGDALKENGRNR